MKEKLIYKLENYERAMSRLQEAISLPLDQSIVLDGMIQRFEFTYELAWKLMKAFLEYEGIGEVNSPRAVFREAYSIGVIEDAEDWLSMISDRNRTSHTYDEEMARLVCQRIIEHHIHALSTLLTSMQKRILSL